MKSQHLVSVLRVVVVVASVVVAISVSQSCTDKPTDDKKPVDSLPPWTQSTIDNDAAWSPDGSRIIYFRTPADFGRDTSWQWGVFLHDVESGEDSCIWPNFMYISCSWSPDGDKLAFSNVDAQIYVHDFSDSSFVRLTFGHRFHSPRWSPCGDKLAFVERTNDGGLFLWDFEADSLIHVASRIEASGGADWMSDCSTLVMLDSCKYTMCSIMGYDIYADSIWIIAQPPGYKREIRISPDQQTIVFGVENDLWGIGINGGEPYRLTTEGGGYPDFSPDGQWIVYTKINRWNGYLWLMRPDGSEKHQITF